MSRKLGSNAPTPMHLRLGNRYETIEQLFNKTRDINRPNKQQDVEIANTQETQWMHACKLALDLATEEQFERAVSIVKEWSIEDRKHDNPTESSYFPVIIRSSKEAEFPFKERSAVLTQYGMDALLEARLNDPSGKRGVDAEESKLGFINIETMNVKINGDYVTVNGVDLPKWSADNDASAKVGVTCSEAWFGARDARWTEACRHLPFSLASTYVTWLMLLTEQAAGNDKFNIDGHGFTNLLTGLIYLASEWATRTSKSRLKKNVDIKGRVLLESWIKGNPPAIPSWMDDWGKPMKYKYVTESDVGIKPHNDKGLAEWSKEAQLRNTPEGADTESLLRSRIPFTEADSGPPYITDSALTTSGPLRAFLCYSTAVECCGSIHLRGFTEYYKCVLHYLGTQPGKIGKQISKVSSPVARALGATSKEVMVPRRVQPSEHVWCDETDCVTVKFEDNYVLQLMCASYDIPTNWESLENKMFENELMGHCLRHIYDEYKHEHVNIHNSDLFDVITHLTNAGSAEGYVRSCLATLPVDGYMSHMKRIALEGIDSSEDKEVSQYERVHWDAIMRTILPPTPEGAVQELKALSNSRSGGADRIRFKSDRNTALANSDRETDAPFVMSSNRKNSTIAMAAHLILNPVTLKHRSSYEVPLPTGIRSVPARILRLIYNMPLPMQSLLQPLYKAMKAYMKRPTHNERYQLALNKGVVVHDSRTLINNSINCVHNPRLVSIADDASKLDQHEGPRARNVLIDALEAIPIDNGFADEFGDSYTDLMRNMLAGWNTNYFAFNVDAEQKQVMSVDTDPSGALITAEKNTVTSAGIQDMIIARTNIPQRDYLWGDDAYAMLTIPDDRNIVELIREREVIATDAGQVMDTLNGSWSGRGVHFLQVYTLWGQRMKRRTAIDHENPARYSMGDSGSLLTKYVMMGTRGGGIQMTNMLILSTIIQASRFKVFGRQFFLPFPTIAAPGGHVNMILTGFPAPNSKLWLSTNYHHIMPQHVKDRGVIKRPAVDQPEHIGARLLSEKDTLEVKVTIGGAVAQDAEGNLPTAGDLMKRAHRKLREQTRHDLYKKNKHKFLNWALTADVDLGDYSKLAYSRSTQGAAEKAIGTQTAEKHLKKWFDEKAMVRAGLISVARGAADAPIPEETESLLLNDTMHVGKVRIAWRFDNDIYLKFKHDEKHNILLFNKAMNPVKEYKYRWHPFWSQPKCMKMLLAYTGVHARPNVLTIKDLTAKFSPHRFRADLHAEDIMGLLKKVPTHMQAQALSFVGFDSHEIEEMQKHIPKIHLYEDLSELDDYSGMDDSVKCAELDRITEFLQMVMSDATYGILDDPESPELRSAVHVQFVSLLADEFNVSYACACSNEIRIRLPIPELSYDV
ncbi:VP2 [Micromonas pusilla reovirus]|uniref:RNA-directed RNA polymerase VP2 n=1 Tax=Micromonas pusilla reovirus (isolate Netherlands/2005) TaxID=649596 RepID=RDRP_MPRVN|nr:VP2 [Micromonas pusilla reovirus]Q1I0V0.1 RecName: Full=RNA-directed RNA polymerase VP2 [Micromonas pusilla reovirus (isolate Netherlands)]AAZ94042.1 VP2 [Micromonas pusilla reovirus]